MRTSENSVKWKSNFRESPKGEVRRMPILRGWAKKLLRYCRATYRGCIFGPDSELRHREREREAGVCLSNRTLRYPDGLRAHARGGRRAATGAAPGSP